MWRPLRGRGDLGELNEPIARQPWAVFELLLVLGFTFGHRVWDVLPLDETWWILALGWLSLRWRGIGWRGVGFTAPSSWPRAIALGAVTGIALQLSSFVTEPLFERLTGTPVDVSELQPVVGNFKLALLYLVAGWLLGALREEAAYRGYLLNRVADVTGHGRAGLAIALIATSALFGLGHVWGGPTAALDSGLHALVLGGLYLAAGRNLWPPLVAHGVSNTVGVGLVYFGML